MRQTVDEPKFDRGGASSHDNRNAVGRFLGGLRSWGRDRHDYIHVESSEFGCQSIQLLDIAVRVSSFDHEVSTLHVAQVIQPVSKCVYAGRVPADGTEGKDADPMDRLRGHANT